MASLFKKLFETISFSGALDACGADIDHVTVGDLSDHIAFVDHGAIAGSRVEAPFPAAPDTVGADDLPIWGYTPSADAPNIEQITCRVRGDEFKKYVVLDKLEFGVADVFGGGPFRKEIEIAFLNRTVTLPLDAASLLATFVTDDCMNGGRDGLWPLVAFHDGAIVQLFVFDIPLIGGGNALPLTMLPPGHPDAAEKQKFLDACGLLGAPSSDNRWAMDALFTDDLWRPLGDTIAETIANPLLGAASVILSATSLRVAVACCLTPCRERGDFQPTPAPGTVGRLYPHIMVISTAPLEHIDAGIRFTRPPRTTVLDGSCGCGHLSEDIASLVVADANVDNLQEYLPTPSGMLGLPTWNNIFNYYESVEAGSPLLNLPMTVVKHDAKAEQFEGAVMRRGDVNKWKVTRVDRQGAFDNIHLAPRMSIPNDVDEIAGGSPGILLVDASVRAKWNMGRVVMAPFCAHDCFHMHWRWTDNSGEPGTFGFRDGKPFTEPGATMVPPNQDIAIRIGVDPPSGTSPPQPNGFLYQARVNAPAMDTWQIVCHHGGGYMLDTSMVLLGAREAVQHAAIPDDLTALLQTEHLDFGIAGFGDDSANVRFLRRGDEISAAASEKDGGYSVFYWKVRYYIEPDQDIDEIPPHERIVINDLARLLKV